MRKILKTRKGFTLVEMVLVIAIIVIITAIIIFSVGSYLNASNSAKASVSQHNSEINQVYDECFDD